MANTSDALTRFINGWLICFSLRALEFWLSHLHSQKGECTVNNIHFTFSTVSSLLACFSPASQVWWQLTTILGGSCPCPSASVSLCFRSCYFSYSLFPCCPLTSTCSWSPDCYIIDSCVQRSRVFLHLHHARASWLPAGHDCKATEGLTVATTVSRQSCITNRESVRIQVATSRNGERCRQTGVNS